MEPFDFTPFLLSLKLASITVVVLFFIAFFLAWFLYKTTSRWKPVVEAFFALPIVLPPSVLGFYILVLFSTSSPIGAFLSQHFHIELVFSFSGLVIASILYSFPFMLQPLQSGLESLNKEMIEASYLSGKSTLQTIRYVVLPNMKPSIISAIVITFAHTIGEFGVVLMVGGSIPHETKVASIAIYEFVEMMEYEYAHIYSAIMVAFSFLVLFIVYFSQQHHTKKIGRFL
ncbi:MAG: molybdate ABC transporter permease subunit [Epsilonproteobacteria bacterium]|nr:molybdate ABC transporter permease subunit [Campylobacterota bacterium]